MPSNKRLLDARFVVGDPYGARSCIWRVWSSRNEVYACLNSLGGIEKLSFHSGGICRKAFTSERGAPEGLSDRKILEWKRQTTPLAGTGSGTCVLEICFPTDFLSRVAEPSTKCLTWIEPAPPQSATVLEFFFTKEPEENIRSSTENVRTVTYTTLPNGESFVVRKRFAVFPGEEFIVPASHHANEHFIFSADDPQSTGRPYRMVVFSRPNDGDRLSAWEYGGFKKNVTDRDETNGGSMTFSRQQVFDRSPR